MSPVRAGQAAAGCGGRAGASRELGWGWTGEAAGAGPGSPARPGQPRAGTEAAAGSGCVRISPGFPPSSARMCAGAVTGVQERFKSRRGAQGAGLGELLEK